METTGRDGRTWYGDTPLRLARFVIHQLEGDLEEFMFFLLLNGHIYSRGS